MGPTKAHILTFFSTYFIRQLGKMTKLPRYFFLSPLCTLPLCLQHCSHHCSITAAEDEEENNVINLVPKNFLKHISCVPKTLIWNIFLKKACRRYLIFFKKFVLKFLLCKTCSRIYFIHSKIFISKLLFWKS